MKKWMIYGASGYTGELIARLAKKKNFHPVLAGRNEEKIRTLADELGLDYRVFDLSNAQTIQNNLSDMELVLLTAGPFAETSAPMVRAALATGTHYLDITGEIAVFEELQEKSVEAQKAGILLLPGVGFDVVPTDCLALELKEALPQAEMLELAFYSHGGHFSRGTARTAMLSLGQGTFVRHQGQLKVIKDFSQKILLPHPYQRQKNLQLYAVSWGDVSTAYHSTGIANIKVYTYFPQKLVDFFLRPFGKLSFLLHKHQKIREHLLELLPAGPDEKIRKTAKMWLWGRASQGVHKIEKSLEVPEGYHFTMLSSLLCVKKVLDMDDENKRPSGFFTPAKLFGAKLTAEVLAFE